MTTLDDVFASVLTVPGRFHDGVRDVRAVYDDPLELTDRRILPPRLRPVDMSGWEFSEVLGDGWIAFPVLRERSSDQPGGGHPE